MAEPQVDDQRTESTKTVSIEVNNKAYEAPKEVLTGAEIKALAEIPPDFQLYLLHGESNKLEEIRNDEEVKLHKNMRFRAVSGQDVS
jgi:hypothetical protein